MEHLDTLNETYRSWETPIFVWNRALQWQRLRRPKANTVFTLPARSH